MTVEGITLTPAMIDNIKWLQDNPGVMNDHLNKFDQVIAYILKLKLCIYVVNIEQHFIFVNSSITFLYMNMVHFICHSSMDMLFSKQLNCIYLGLL